MITILFRVTQLRPWEALPIIVLGLMFHCIDLCKAETEKENPKKDSVLEMTFSGTGSQKTQPFTVEDGWKIRWETESPTFKLSAHGSARRPYNGPTNERDEVLRWFEVLEPIVLANTTINMALPFTP